LGGKITRENPLTYHHIKPVREGGRGTIENGALLTDEKHRLFNELERKFPELADEINKYFLAYHGDYPEDVWCRIQYLLSMAAAKEVYHSKGKCKKKKHRHRR